MIAFLKGTLAGKTTTTAYIEVSGVGYAVGMSQASLSKLPEAGSAVEVHTYLQVRDDGLSLFGFLSLEEKALFERLIGVGGVAIAMLVATVLTPFHEWEELASDGADAQAAAPASQPEPTSADDAARASSSQKPQAPAVKAASSEDGEPASRGKSAKPEGGYVDSPWRRTCQRIAELYKLSPRETEIFFFIAKGRNAEYVQQELVISMHTAKTHIANIYHKLGVHSSQEMLTLIETFRREDIEKQGAKLGERKAVKD